MPRHYAIDTCWKSVSCKEGSAETVRLRAKGSYVSERHTECILTSSCRFWYQYCNLFSRSILLSIIFWLLVILTKGNAHNSQCQWLETESQCTTLFYIFFLHKHTFQLLFTLKIRVLFPMKWAHLVLQVLVIVTYVVCMNNEHTIYTH